MLHILPQHFGSWFELVWTRFSPLHRDENQEPNLLAKQRTGPGLNQNQRFAVRTKVQNRTLATLLSKDGWRFMPKWVVELAVSWKMWLWKTSIWDCSNICDAQHTAEQCPFLAPIFIYNAITYLGERAIASHGMYKSLFELLYMPLPLMPPPPCIMYVKC